MASLSSNPSLKVPLLVSGPRVLTRHARTPSHSFINFNPLVTKFPFGSGFKDAFTFTQKQRPFTVSATNFGGDFTKKESDSIASGDSPQGPPFLTILAGFLVFFLICWIFGSILIWLFGLIVRPPTK